MNLLRKLFAPKEVRAALGVLDELECTLDCSGFRIIRQEVEDMILAHRREFASMVRQGTPPRQWVLGAVSNVAAQHVESGQYHMYRGLLSPMGPGEHFLRIYDAMADELVRMGVLEADFAAEQKAGLRENIKSVG